MRSRAARRGPAMRAAAGAGARGTPEALRLAQMDELCLFSDRLDDAADYERIVKEFATLHDEARSADSFG